jgi:nicotinamidase-related amidase
MDGPDRCRALLLIDFQDDFLADDGRMPVARD